MTLDEMKQREDNVKAAMDRLDKIDQMIAYVYLHRAYDMRITDCEKALARLLFDGRGQ